MEKIQLTTSDGLHLSTLFWNNDAFSTVILLHAMPVQKESYVALGDALAKAGHNVLAIDFRGHGESDGGDYKTFTPADHAEYLLDLEAAVQYAEATFPHTEIYLIGASIGANTVVKYMAAHHDIAKGVLLSAGLEYHGMKAADDILNLDVSQNLLIIAAKDDKGRDVEAAALAERTASQHNLIIVESGGHGAEMFTEHPELILTIEEFLA